MTLERSRRQFLRHTVAVGAGILVAAHSPRPLAFAAAARSKAPEMLTSAEWGALEAMTAQIIPTDHQPGALEANCVNFIDKALANEDAAALPLYRGGLAAIDVYCRSQYTAPFVDLTALDQQAVLSTLEQNTLEGWPLGPSAPPAMFFENLRIHTIVGFLAAPTYGGNAGFAGWQVVGYPGPEHHLGGYTSGQVEGVEKIVPVWERDHGDH